MCEGVTFLYATFMKVAIDKNSKTAFISSYDETVAGPTKKMLV